MSVVYTCEDVAWIFLTSGENVAKGSNLLLVGKKAVGLLREEIFSQKIDESSVEQQARGSRSH